MAREKVSLAPSTFVRDYFEDVTETLRWLERFEPPPVDETVKSINGALPGYLREGLKSIGVETHCSVLAFTATGGLWRGAEWLLQLEGMRELQRLRERIRAAGWSAEPLDWGDYTLRNCGPLDRIERVQMMARSSSDCSMNSSPRRPGPRGERGCVRSLRSP